MITFFPNPYQDELLYSIIARYHVWSGNNKMSDTMNQLFDDRNERATLLIPTHLKRLAEKTKKFGLDYKTLLYEHTMFPLISCFLSKATYDNILFSVINENQKENTLFIYRRNMHPRFLRYCPHCIIDDRDEYGEAYWHRKHQSYGIVMCDKHKCRLKDSDIELADNRKRNNRFIALELLRGINDTFEYEDISDCRNEMQMAYDVDYIYKNYEFVRAQIQEKHILITEATIELLFKRNLATKEGGIKNIKLRQEFQNMYFSAQLKQLLADLDGNNNYAWLFKLCRGNRFTTVPIRFILFADFLAGSMESFVKIVNEQKQFTSRTKKTIQPPDGYEEKLELYRERWHDVMEKNPDKSRKYLSNANRTIYRWLMKYDREWFLNNLPQIQKSKKTLKDWAKIDNELESMVDDAVYHIKNLENIPERITIASIIRHMQQKKLINVKYKLLPCTLYKINQYVENISDYRLRKIEWAKSELEKEGRSVAPWIILQKACIRTKDWNKFRHLLTS